MTTPRRLGMLRGPLLAVALAMLLLVPATAVASSHDELDDARQRLADVRDRLEQVGAACERNQRRVAELNDGVEDALAAVGEAEGAVEQQRRTVAQVEGRLSDLDAEAENARAVSTARVVELYKRGVSDPAVQTLLTSPTTQAALSRAQMVSVVEHADGEAIERLLASQAAVDAERDVLERHRRAYDRVLDEREEILGDLERLQATYERKVGRCNDELSALQRQEDIAAGDEARLSAALAQNPPPEEIPQSTSTSSGWAWPASGPLTSGFGQRWGRLHAGIDIGAPTGAPIYAASAGVVSYAGVMGGYGNIIVIDHGGGMTTRYAHQSQLAAAVGQTVRPGDQIGYIGSTGNVTGPHLHFEIRLSDSPQDPIGYLP